MGRCLCLKESRSPSLKSLKMFKSRFLLSGFVCLTAGFFTPRAGLGQPMPSQEQMMKVGQCMASLDPAAMESMQSKGQVFRQDLKRLCKAGNRDAALQRARQFGMEMAKDPTMQQIKACTADLKMPQQRYEVPKEKLSTKDICDF